jgi:hypothetical protein
LKIASVIGRHAHLVALCLGGGLALFEHADGLHQHLGVVQQVGPDLGAERIALGVVHVDQVRGGRCCGHQAGKCQRGEELHALISVVGRLAATRNTSCARIQPGEPWGSRAIARLASASASSIRRRTA